MAGLFLSFDGVDGCGKSTQIELLKEWLTSLGHTSRVVRDPGGTQLGEALRDILLHRTEIPLAMTAELLMYMASRAQLVSEVIAPALGSGEVVIADRYLLASVVYQGIAGGLGRDAVWQVGKVATGGLMPALTVVLDLAAEKSFARIEGGLDRLESRGLEYMTRVREGFLMESRSIAQAVVVDADRSIQEIHQDVREAIVSRQLLSSL